MLLTAGPAGLAAAHGQGWLQVGELLLAFALSSVVGLEREFRGKSAGVRTQSIVGTASALMMLVSKYGFGDVVASGLVNLDPSRVAAQIVSGVGFLGGEWFLFWYLFTHHHRGNARSERIRLYTDHLIFERRDAKGAVVVERLQPYWLNVILERAEEPDNALYLRSHGRSILIGDFLSPDERRDLARELKDVLGRHRRPAYS